jgi:AhpD family alkylhydroperoxidase
MARLPLLAGNPQDPITAEVFEVFEREGRRPIDLYRALANAPEMLRAYATLAQGLRYEARSARSLRELVILRTAQVTGSAYEWAHHRPMALAAGVTERQLEELVRWETSDAFDERERAALRLAEESHALAVTDETFNELRRLLSVPEVLELVLTAAFYQLVARLIQSFDLEVESDYRPELSLWPPAR